MTDALRSRMAAQATRRDGALGSARAVAGAGAVVGAATVAVNGLAYVVPVVAARVLAHGELGALSALLAVGAVAAVVGVGLQTALAVRWARERTAEGADRVSLVTAGVTAGALLVAVPVLAATLHLPLLQPALLAVLTFPVVLAGRWLGEMQGRQRYGKLAIGMILLSLARYGGILVALVAGRGVTAALAAGAAASYVSVAAIAMFTGRNAGAPLGELTGRSAGAQLGERTGRRVGWREVLRAGGATTAMLAVSSADLVLARALLPLADADSYAVGSVLTKGALWAPGVLTVLALPLFAQARRNAVRVTLAGVAACGFVLVSAAALFGGLAVRLAGGADYAHLATYAAGFGVVGALYALVFVIINAEIAASVRRPAVWLWVALAGMGTVMALARPSTVGGVLVVSIATAATATAATAATYAIRHRRSASST